MLKPAKACGKEKAQREAGAKKQGGRLAGAAQEPVPVSSVKPGPRVQVIRDPPPPPKREVATVGDSSTRQPHDSAPLDELLAAGFVSDEEPSGGAKPHGKHHSWKQSKAGGGLKLKRGIVRTSLVSSFRSRAARDDIYSPAADAALASARNRRPSPPALIDPTRPNGLSLLWL